MTIEAIRKLPKGTILMHREGRLTGEVALVKPDSRDDKGRVLVALRCLTGSRFWVRPRTLEVPK
jgi:hypothetical protein